MISRQEVLKIVAEKYNIIIADNDPILSVLAVSDAIYDIYAARLAAEVTDFSAKNTAHLSQKVISIQSETLRSLREIGDDNRRGLSEILGLWRTDWGAVLQQSQNQDEALLSEFRKIRTQIFWGLTAVGLGLILFSLIIWFKGV